MEPFSIEEDTVSMLDSMDDDDLHSFADSQNGGFSDEEIELHIYTYMLIFKRHSTHHLDAATQRAGAWLAETLPGHSHRARRASILASTVAWTSPGMTTTGGTDREIACLYSQAIAMATECQVTRNLVDLNKAIAIMDLAMKLAGDRVQPSMLQDYGAMIGFRLTITQSVGDLDRAIDLTTRAIEGTSQGYANLEASRSLQTWVNARFQQTGSMSDLNRLIEVGEIIVATAPRSHRFRIATMANLQTWSYTRFDKTGSMVDLNRAIDLAASTLEILPLSIPHQGAAPSRSRYDGVHPLPDIPYPDRDVILRNLQVGLTTRSELTGSKQDLDRIIDTTNSVITAQATAAATGTSLGAAQAMRLCRIGNTLLNRFLLTNSLHDLDQAIDATKQATDSCTPQDNPDHAITIVQLVDLLCSRFEQTGSIANLNQAIDITATAAGTDEYTFNNAGDQVNLLARHIKALALRSERTSSMEDLNHAIDVGTAAVDMMPQDFVNRSTFLDMFGNRFNRRYERLSSREDLDRSIEIATTAIDAGQADPDDHQQHISIANLANYLRMRFEQLGSLEDIDRAIAMTTSLCDTAGPSHNSNRCRFLLNLSLCHRLRFERLRSPADLHLAVEIASAAVDATPLNHFYKGRIVSNLGNSLRIRYEHTQSEDDLNRAMRVLEAALDEMPKGHPDRITLLTNHAVNITAQLKRTLSPDDLQRAISTAQAALDETPLNHPARAQFLYNYVNLLLGRRSFAPESAEDVQCILASCREGWRLTTAASSFRLGLARIAAGVLVNLQDWQEASQLLHDVVHLAPAVSPRSLKHTDKQHMLQEFAGMASLAAAVALNAGKDVCYALQLLELGRGVIAGSLIDMRGDISELRREHAHLADEFVALRDELDASAGETIDQAGSPSPLLSPQSLDVSSWESRLRERRKADQQFQALTSRIRAQPSFDRFLLPPTAEQLMAAAGSSPIVVVNLSSYRSDAFLVERHRIRAIALPALQHEEAAERLEQLQQCRRHLGSDSSSSHAIMKFVLEWLWDVACSPCLEALGLHGAVSVVDADNMDSWPHVWWIPTGILGQFPLHAAGRYHGGQPEESGTIFTTTDTVLDRTVSSYASSIKALIYARRTRHLAVVTTDEEDLEAGRTATTATALLVAMAETPGLGSGSGALPSVHREVTLVQGLCASLGLQVVATPPSPPRRWPAKLVDEGVHLVSAFQLAGFRHVVGTLWEVSDGHCADVAEVLYHTLHEQGMTDAAVSWGLHRAIKRIRDRSRVGGHVRAGNDDDSAGEDHDLESEQQRLERDVLKVSKRRRNKPTQRPTDFFWVLYIHFGA